MFIYFVCIAFGLWALYCWTITLESMFFEQEDKKQHNYPTPVVQKKAESVQVTWDIYESTRFVIVGNMGWRVVITDKHTLQDYYVMHSNLAKFRSIFPYIKKENKDKFIVVTITKLTGIKSAA